MKQIFVKACARITAYRCITTHHLAQDGVVTKKEFRVEEDDPIIIQVHESQSLEDVCADDLHQSLEPDVHASFLMKALKPVMNRGNIKKSAEAATDVLVYQHDATNEVDFSEDTVTSKHGKYVCNNRQPLSIEGMNTLHKKRDMITEQSPLENETNKDHDISQHLSQTEKVDKRQTRAAHSQCKEKVTCISKRARRKVKNCVNAPGKLKSDSISEKKLIKCGQQLHKEDNEFNTGLSASATCEMCCTTFESNSLLKLHINKVHKSSDTLSCPLCCRSFTSVSGLTKHKNGGTCTQSYTCNVCGKSYDSKSRDSYTKHMNNHKLQAEGVKFTCEKCGRVYMSRDALKKHRKSHLGIKPHTCQECGKSFALSYMVRDHMRTHTGVKPFLCNICGQGFSISSHLARHLRSHSRGTLNKRGRNRKDCQEHNAEHVQTQEQSCSMSGSWIHSSDELHSEEQHRKMGDNQQHKSFISHDNPTNLYTEHYQNAPTDCERPEASCITQLSTYSDQQELRTLQEADGFYQPVISPQYQHSHAEDSGRDYQKGTGLHTHANVLTQPLQQLPSTYAQISSEVEDSCNRKWSPNFSQYPLTTSVIPEESPNHSYQMPFPAETFAEPHHQ